MSSKPNSPSALHAKSQLRSRLRYNPDSAQLMLRLSTLEMPVFLDSSHDQSNCGRFDILSANPIAHIKIESGRLRVSDPEIEISGIDFFNGIRLLKQKYLPEPDPQIEWETELPFQGGILGYLGYPSLHGKNAIEIRDAFVGVYLWAVIVDHLKQSSHLVFHPQCPTAEKTRMQNWLSADEDFQAALAPANFSLRSPFTKELSRADYNQAFKQIAEFIAAGDCYQVNLTQQFRADCSGSPLAAYLLLRESTRAPFSAYINWGNGALLSLSPERFLKLTGTAVLTQPIKGTRPRGDSIEADERLAAELCASEKDRAENLMIVDLLRNDLGRVCKTGSIKATALFDLQSFSNVHHMVSSVSGELADDRDALDLLSSCFPGGSVTGAPKLRAMTIIEQLEAKARRAYCGTVFYLSANGNMDSNITIRTLLWQQDQLFCWAGGGIVSDSDCDAEYEECFHKISNIISVLQEQEREQEQEQEKE